MERISADNAIKELTMMLIYLTRFSEHDRFTNPDDSFAWKGYDFDVLNQLSDEDYIRQGTHPSRSKSVYITEAGKEKAKKLLQRYGIDDIQ